MNSPLIETRALKKYYQEKGGEVLKILKGIDLALNPGEALGIQGRSGSGKSTLLHLLGGLDQPTKGEVLFQGQNLAQMEANELNRYRNEQIGFVFQSHHLLGDFSALENVMIPALIQGNNPPEARARAKELLERVGLSERIEHRPGALSGGERQRVAIARALVNRPKLLLCDEPTGSLDVVTGKQVADLLFEVSRDETTSLILVTHSQELAQRLQRQMELRQGVLQLQNESRP